MNFIFLAQDAAARGVGAGIAGLGLVFLILAILATVFWIWMLIDCLTSSREAIEKLIWLLVIFFLHILGALIYYFVGRNQRRV